MPVRAVVAVRNGKIECVAGVTLEKGISIAFSDLHPTDANKFEIFKTALAMTKWMKQFHPTVVLTPEDKSHKFIEKLGFAHVKDNENLNIYRL